MGCFGRWCLNCRRVVGLVPHRMLVEVEVTSAVESACYSCCSCLPYQEFDRKDLEDVEQGRIQKG